MNIQNQLGRLATAVILAAMRSAGAAVLVVLFCSVAWSNPVEPQTYSVSIDRTAVGDDPFFLVTAGPGGENREGVPSRVRFDGIVENLRADPITLELAAGFNRRPPWGGIQSELFTFDDLHLPGLNQGGLPVPVPLHLSLEFADSFPEGFIYFEAQGYTYEGVRLQGELQYAIGVPEPSALAAGLLLLAMAWLTLQRTFRQTRS
jgi:hypothetical protein